MTGPDLAGRSAIVTGANRGLGLEIARSLGLAGASVLLCARDADALAAAVETLAGEGLSVSGEAADVSRPEHAERIVRAALERFGSLEILVNNAGVYGPKGLTEEVPWDDWVRAVEVNLFGSVLMARTVLPHFRAAGYGKIVQLSGGGATAPLPNLSAYAASKAAVIRFAETLAHEVRDSNIDVNSIAPGALNTRMLDEVLAAGPEAVGAGFYERAARQQAEGGTPLELAARLTVFLCSAESDGISGRLISAVWDAWESLPLNREALDNSDLFTLRRIVPADRGVRWTS
jgi:NAD(P)-dependent dehydrogenase (short-subunit alcohol dehydrogenase family)